MLRKTLFSLFILSASGSVSTVFSQATANVTVRMVDSVYTVNPSKAYNGTVTDAVSVSGLTVPAGSGAIVKVVANAGAPRTYSLSLTSVAVNGQTVKVSGGSPTFTSMSTVAGVADNTVNSTLSGVGNKGQRGKRKTAATRTPVVSGTRLYVPAGSDVEFVLDGTPLKGQASQTAAATGTSTQPAAPTTTGSSAAPSQQTTAGTPASGTTPAQPTTTTAAGSLAAPAPPTSSTSSAGSNTVVYENIQYQLQSCQREAPHIVCQVQITNLNTADAMLNGAGGTYFVDQAGNKVMTLNRSIANCKGFGRCQLLPNLAMAGRFEFMDQEGHATTLSRLLIAENGKPVAQFTEVPVN